MQTVKSAYDQAKQSWISLLTYIVAGLAIIATGGGILTAFGQTHRSFLTLSGETVQIQGGGLYGHESVSMAAQGVGMDLVTLLVATPLLLLANHLAAKGSLRFRLLRIGAFWYFTYSYLLILFGVTYNPLFLVYVVLLSTSLLGLILSVLSVDVAALPAHVSPRLARRMVAWIVIGVSSMFALLWLSRIVPALVSGKPPVGLESYTTLSVQGADLAIVIPMSILVGTLLLRRQPVGYLFAFPVVVFLATMGLALVGMVIAMAAMGTAVGAADFVPAGISATLGIGLTLHLVLSIRTDAPAFWFSQAGQRRQPRRAHSSHQQVRTEGPSVTEGEDRWPLAGVALPARLRTK
ncbi:MAG TPA: hypothetical protein VIN01_09770 [Candidatus Dormibacteraeota bacterium]|jgi:hypothetical protein